MRLSSTLAIVLVLGLPCSAYGQATAIDLQATYDAVVRGMACTQQSTTGSIECVYRIGQSLRITIAGVGEPDAGITFEGGSMEGDFYATFGIAHGCVIIKPGSKNSSAADFAFISPVTGRVHRTWQQCQGDRVTLPARR